MAVKRCSLFILSIFMFSIFTISISDDADCVYTVYVKTKSVNKGGTNSNIILTLYDTNRYGIRINNLESWGGLMGQGYNYFERGNLDIFSGRGPCLTGPICEMNLTSDGSGSAHGWYCDYVEVTMAGVHQQCAGRHFDVEQWLAMNTSPYELTAVRDYCWSNAHKRDAHASDLLVTSVA